MSRPTPPKTAVRRLALARLISITGGAAAYTALMFSIYQRTKSPAWLTFTLLATFGVGGFLGPIGGAIGDRFDRRRVMIVSDLLGAASFVALALAHAPLLLVAIAFVATVAEIPFWSASGAAIPNLVEGEKDISWANSLIAVGKNAGIMIGPAIGGVLVASIGPGWVFAANALSYAISAGLAFTVRANFSAARSSEDEHRGIRAGFLFLRRDRIVRTIALAGFVFSLGAAMGMVADVPLADLFGVGSVGFGLLITAWGAGSVAGSFAGRFLTARTEGRGLVMGVALIAVCGFAVALSPSFSPILVLSLFWGFGDAVSLVAQQGIIQRRTPDAVRSRVMAVTDAVMQVAMAASFALAGLALSIVGPQGVYAIGGVAAVLSVMILIPVLGISRKRKRVVAETAVEAEIEAAAT